MCGIVGIISKDNKEIKIKEITSYLTHRGPDNIGIFECSKNNIFLGHTRLSIIDVNPISNQPFHDTSNNFIIIFNGEIYNYHKLRKELINLGFSFKTNSDTEVIINAYKKWGVDCVSKMRGMFAFCIYDKIKNCIFLARDRLGIKPLFYFKNKDYFLFSSEIKPILKSGFCDNALSDKSINQFFSYGSVQQPDTIFENIRFLEPGNCLVIEKDLKIKKWNYYRIEDQIINYNTKNFEENVLFLRHKLEEVTKLHMTSDVEVGAFLSAGVD